MDNMEINGSSPFDPDEALSIVGGDKQLFLELVNIFRENYPSELSSIQEAVRLADAEALRRASHHLKGTLSALAAGPARAAAVRLEDIGRTADLSRAAATYAEIERQVQALDAALANWAG
jgi:two-component system, sensor histidine kinase and response regulator